MKRRLLTVLLAGVLAAALTGCGGSDKGEIPVLIPVQAPRILVLSQ